MPLKPQSRSYSSPLPEFQPIQLRVDSPVEAVKDQRDPDKELVSFHFTVLTPPWSQTDPPHRERQRHGNTVNAKQDGTASLLAQLINAAHPADLSKTEMLDFDLEQLVGRVVEGVGRIKEDERGRFWNVVAYRRPGQTPTAAVPPAPAGTLAPNGKPFERIENGHGLWFDGSAWQWHKLPESPPPPPPPAAAPPPPPPPAAAAPPPPAPTAELKF